VEALAQQLADFLLRQRNELLVIERQVSDMLLSDLTEFAKQNSNAIPIEIAPFVASLKGTLGADDPKAISQGRVALESRLSSIVGFPQFRAAREVERLERAKAELADLTTRIKVLSDFIQTYVRSNITSGLIEPLMKLNEEVVAALVSPQTDSLTRLLATAELKVGELGLLAAYEEFKRTH
jgi:hypothetical protein